ncbi:hypothetical protein INT44_008388 [Umbelopsis vinacea]|uniref:F-box domain-containing protein n=1 Tax=Umbelopsis vinacea TaxID=44442 RepID=A0A8H7PXD7_9FUNG|nr:hypothetical protein INT44_008388 [Umbelopsis vinacea]
MALRITDLPQEILINIFKRLDIDDVLALEQTCQLFDEAIQDSWAWHQMYHYRYGNFTKKADQYEREWTWRQKYEEKASLKLSVANDFEIAHLNGIHWRKCESSESEYGSIAMMQQVCWLDANSTIRSVSPGTYRVLWRIRVWDTVLRNQQVDFTAIPQVDDTGMIPRGSSIFTSPRGWFSETEVQGRGWAVMALPSKLVIDKEWGLTDVRVSVERKDDQWKGGMDFDWVQLQRIDNDLPVTSRLRTYKRVRELRNNSRFRNEFRVEDPGYPSLSRYIIISTVLTYFLFWLKQQIAH